MRCWDDVFPDLDPVRGLAPCERWQKALKAAADRCEALRALLDTLAKAFETDRHLLPVMSIRSDAYTDNSGERMNRLKSGKSVHQCGDTVEKLADSRIAIGAGPAGQIDRLS
jgi:hypothetical protein